MIYPRIKDQAFLSKSSGVLKDYFGSLFLRLSANNRNGVFNTEVRNCARSMAMFNGVGALSSSCSTAWSTA